MRLFANDRLFEIGRFVTIRFKAIELSGVAVCEKYSSQVTSLPKQFAYLAVRRRSSNDSAACPGQCARIKVAT